MGLCIRKLHLLWCVHFNQLPRKWRKVVAVDFQGGNFLCCTHISSEWDLKMPDFFPFIKFQESWSHGWEDFYETPEFQVTAEYIALDLTGKSESRCRSVNQISKYQAWARIAVFTFGRMGCITNRAFSPFPSPALLSECFGVYYLTLSPTLVIKKNQTLYFLHHTVSNCARWLSVNLHTKLAEKRGL